MRRTGWVLLAALLLGSGTLRAQDGERLLTAAGGGMLGVAGGGYVALSIIVAESRAGRYIHDFDDVFGWRSLPVIAGGTLGTALGIYSPERLRRAVLFGFGGLAAGGVLGFGLGQLIWEGPEGKWAGAAIGAGAGLAIAYIVGALTASGDDDIGQGNISVPVLIRVPVP
jgi:hypothetical protein